MKDAADSPSSLDLVLVQGRSAARFVVQFFNTLSSNSQLHLTRAAISSSCCQIDSCSNSKLTNHFGWTYSCQKSINGQLFTYFVYNLSKKNFHWYILYRKNAIRSAGKYKRKFKANYYSNTRTAEHKSQISVYTSIQKMPTQVKSVWQKWYRPIQVENCIIKWIHHA